LKFENRVCVYIYSKRENFQPYQEFCHSSDMQKIVHRLQSPPFQQRHDQEREKKTLTKDRNYVPTRPRTFINLMKFELVVFGGRLNIFGLYALSIISQE
jgi:hypothetical protein